MKLKRISGSRSPKYQFICTDKTGDCNLGIWQTGVLSSKETAEFIKHLKIYPWQK